MQLPRYYGRIITGALFLLCILAIGGVASENATNEQSSSKTADFSWTTIPLTDAQTGETFTIQNLIQKGKPVLIHTFAVWCPACTIQLQETTKLVKGNPDAYTILGIDTDPNENSEMVKNHINKNGFSGKFTVAPKDLTQGLVNTFGAGIILSAPQTISIANNKVRHLGDGVINSDKLLQIVPPEQ